MNIIKTDIEGVLIIDPEVYSDDRGYFLESYNRQKYTDAGIDAEFVQDNISKSVKGTIRGLHYQVGDYAQGKLCQVLSGHVLDIAVDIRMGSPTYGKYVAVDLTYLNHRQIWIPPGFAHGFSVLSEEAVFSYKCTAFYSKKDERSILYNDKDLNIYWMTENEIVSEKDLRAESFKNIKPEFKFTG